MNSIDMRTVEPRHLVASRLSLVCVLLLACGGSDGTDPAPPSIELQPDNTLLVETGSSTALDLATKRWSSTSTP